MLPSNYTSAILRDYEKKRDANLLSSRLTHPSPAKLRDQCSIAYDQLRNRKDEKILRDFFGQESEKVDWPKIISRFDRDRFRPLVNYMNRETNWTEDQNVELLAWLIDFQLRPYDRTIDYETGEIADNSGTKSEEPKEPPDVIQPEKRPPLTKTFKTSIFTALIITILGSTAIAIYYPVNNKPVVVLERRPEKSRISTSIALDSEKISQIKQIMNWDTLTLGSIRGIWYFKSRGELELYTAPGPYPSDQRFRLLPLSEHIYNKYVVPKQHRLVATSN